jgi:hypothetical protein
MILPFEQFGSAVICAEIWGDFKKRPFALS